MLFSYAVRAIYIESCSMFVRGGVYKVVHEAMGGTLAKFSVSALMFDYVLTGPISAVSAGLYLGGLINETGEHLHIAGMHVYPPYFAAGFAAVVTIYFWRKNIIGIHESSEKALRIMQITTVMVVILIVWCLVTIFKNGYQPVPLPVPGQSEVQPRGAGLAAGHGGALHHVIAVMIGLGHSLLAMSGEESLAQVNREIAHPKLKNLERAGFVIFIYSMLFTSLVSFFAVMIIPDSARQGFLDNLIGGLSMYLVGPILARLLFHGFVVLVGTLILAGAVNTAIIGSNGVLNRVAEDGVLPDWFRHPHKKFGTTSRLINLIVDPAIGHHPDQPRRRLHARRGVRLRRGVELRHEGALGAGAALQAAGKLGKQLAKVRDLMHAGQDVPTVSPSTPMADVIFEMSSKKLGMTTVQETGQLRGVISDGDLRRLLEREGGAALGKTAGEAMNAHPRTIAAEELAARALAILEERKITSLVVVDAAQKVEGVVHLHDLWGVELI